LFRSKLAFGSANEPDIASLINKELIIQLHLPVNPTRIPKQSGITSHFATSPQWREPL
jgi:hypothetical protein